MPSPCPSLVVLGSRYMSNLTPLARISTSTTMEPSQMCTCGASFLNTECRHRTRMDGSGSISDQVTDCVSVPSHDRF